jgi:hypothetical protein
MAVDCFCRPGQSAAGAGCRAPRTRSTDRDIAVRWREGLLLTGLSGDRGRRKGPEKGAGERGRRRTSGHFAIELWHYRS